MRKNFKEIWTELDADGKRELAAKGKTSVAYLSQVANGQRNAGRKTIGNLMSADERINFEMFVQPEDQQRRAVQ
jgi:hypothetical protein